MDGSIGAAHPPGFPQSYQQVVRIDTGSDDRQAYCDIDTPVDSQDFDRRQALVVVHGHHDVEVAASGPEERSIGRDRAGDIHSFCPGPFDGWQELGLLLPVAKQTVFPGMGVDAADDHSRFPSPQLPFHGLPG